MFHLDTLSSYAICGIGSFVGAAMLRLAEPDDPATRQALRTYGLGLLILGLALVPAGLGTPRAGLPLVQLALTAGSLAALVVISQALAQIQATALSPSAMAMWLTGAVACCAVAWLQGPMVLGQVYAVGLAVSSSLGVWCIRRFALRPRDFTERALGLSMAALCGSAWVRAAFTLADHGPPRVHLLYVPEALTVAFAALYGVLPLIVTALLLNLVNARLRQQLRERAVTDELTGAMSRRALRELAPALILQAHARGQEVAVLMLDLDRFKLINDTHGHAVGDRVLVLATAALRAQIRPDALLARYGGEEFVLVVPVADLPAARSVAERLRLAVEQAGWAHSLALQESITVSIGVALAGPRDDLDTVLGRADEALYRAKREGRNQCQVALVAA